MAQPMVPAVFVCLYIYINVFASTPIPISAFTLTPTLTSKYKYLHTPKTPLRDAHRRDGAAACPFDCPHSVSAEEKKGKALPPCKEEFLVWGHAPGILYTSLVHHIFQ